ncbi:MAG: cytochrome-c oxidase, cbb3-type subunit II, partial [Verrucomicrobiota bacterium]|nr:cytochrome-c oxidase, cbb3-type subunit II [Verrucomicrobiota bacterium]
PALTGPKPVYAGFQMMLETQPIKFGVWVLVAVLIGGVIEFIPMFAVKSNIPTIASVQPYTPLELEGRDIYVREGCYTCHSQMIRPFRAETERYGEYSKAGEFVYDHPFQFGSRRIGPDLHRIGGKYPDIWHYRHMENPRSTSQGSIMPNYDFLLTTKLSTLDTKAKIKAMQTLGVPYSREDIENAVKDLKNQAKQIGDGLAAQGVLDSEDKEIVALIAYMQRLGTDIKKEPIASR